tara:strand:+ start:316 stop:450 length:135 start_codon:yes stop_codon:yes gene_type:complete
MNKILICVARPDDETIGCKPEDALRTFYSSGIDALSIGGYLIKK